MCGDLVGLEHLCKSIRGRTVPDWVSTIAAPVVVAAIVSVAASGVAVCAGARRIGLGCGTFAVRITQRLSQTPRLVPGDTNNCGAGNGNPKLPSITSDRIAVDVVVSEQCPTDTGGVPPPYREA
jgi:hypothetical protein